MLAMMVAVVGMQSNNNLHQQSSASQRKQVVYAAYAGLESAMNELRKDDTFSGDVPGSGRHAGALYGDPDLVYEVEVTNNLYGAPGTNKTASDGSTVYPGTVYLQSSGIAYESGTMVTQGGAVGTARKVRPVFEDGAYARSLLSVANTEIDAWDSAADGDYDNGHGGGGGGGGSGGGGSTGNIKDDEATIGGDAKAVESILVGAGTKLDGQIQCAPTTASGPLIGTPSEPAPVMITPGALIDVTPQAERRTEANEVPRFRAPYHPNDANGKYVDVNNHGHGPPPGSPPGTPGSPPDDYVLDPGAYAEVTVHSNQTLVLKSGVYYFRDKFDMHDSEIKLDIHHGDPVTVFFGKKAVIMNSDVNKWGDAVELQFCFSDEEKDPVAIAAELPNYYSGDRLTAEQAKVAVVGAKLEYSFADFGNSDIQACTAGRNLVGKVHGGEYFGAIMAQDFFLSNTKLHQDLSLKGANLLTAGNWALEGVHEVKK
ncbi:MAG: hypothetical protein KC910_08085 [Candidatus Eremiobacteraeota bacterium]|nr:hypothetical protein [Candidatus Eremiobacteraeota bacterium]